MQILSKVVSWVFLPLFMPFYGLLLTLYIPSQEANISNPSLFGLPGDLKTQILFLFLVFTALAPGMSFVLMYRRGLLSSVEMDERKERLFPLFIMLSYCILLFFLFWKKAPDYLLPIYIYSLPLTGALVALVFILITSNYKISLHAAGAGILTGYLFAFGGNQMIFNPGVIFIGILTSGLILSARLYLNKHTPNQVYSGWIIAFIVTYFSTIGFPLFI
ncbi:MAG: phosphatase PAP2 family protein [Crocinitomicaceae bacterium]|nr:phosphatase PAP2 family protein [Crocinitomicaceae bacterium]MDG1735637.1 phosphatase PAP2 family protein [Crocinitomicaceae bacterium]MDG2505946.1 phosphatase PAP2 family protein [Crocinitomicaceae bacterium]